MSCYFRYMKDVLKEAGISVTPKNKKEIDQAIHKMMAVQYKKCMPDCWGKIKQTLANEKSRKTFVSNLKKALTA